MNESCFLSPCPIHILGSFSIRKVGERETETEKGRREKGKKERWKEGWKRRKKEEGEERGKEKK